MTSRAKQGCWTCKKRKVGCDKTTPWCNNCTRTGRVCLGYGLRLVWADCPDGRRKEADNAVYAAPAHQSRSIQRHDGHFLNFTFEDLVLARAGSPRRAMGLGRPRPSVSLHTPLLGQDAMFLSYYENTISPMVSTTRSINGFSIELLPQVLRNRSSSALALCNAMLAISAFHRFGCEAALAYKSKAIRYLKESLDRTRVSGSSSDRETQLAACMMLCMYSVFDETDGNWHIHLDGAKKMLQSLQLDGAPSLSSDFLPNWFLYYEVLGNFTVRGVYDHSPVEADSSWLSQIPESNKSLIIGYLGCSVEVFEILHRINQLRTSTVSGRDPLESVDRTEQRLKFESRLNNLVQRLAPEEEEIATPTERTRSLTKAELYRLAALLYLQRVCPMDGDSMIKEIRLEQALSALRTLPVVSSPWPLFIVAGECQSDEQRVAILRMLDKMEEARNIGNIFITRAMIEKFWKQQDLRVDDASKRDLRCWHLVDCEVRVPWFA